MRLNACADTSAILVVKCLLYVPIVNYGHVKTVSSNTTGFVSRSKYLLETKHILLIFNFFAYLADKSILYFSFQCL